MGNQRILHGRHRPSAIYLASGLQTLQTSGEPPHQPDGLGGQLYAASDVLPNDGLQRWRGSRPTRRADPKGASVPHALRPRFVSRLPSARPRAPRPDVADNPGHVCEGASGSDGVRGELARRGALVRRGPGGEGTGDHAPRSIREDPRWSVVGARGPLGRRGDRMGAERRLGFRPDREDGPSGPLSPLGGPTMDAFDEHLAPTRIDVRDARPRLRGRAGPAVQNSGETPSRRRVLGPTRARHVAAGMLEAGSTAHGGLPAGPRAGPTSCDDYRGHRTSPEGTAPRFEAEGEGRRHRGETRP